MKQPKDENVKLDFKGDDFPEAEKAPASMPFPDLPSGPMPMPSGSDRLSPARRSSSEAGLGHDLGHVRLHRGSDAERVTSSYHADGVTTGSHVYMRPSLDPGVGAGARVFRHELSHVVEQTGARPLGGMHSSRPSIGSPGRGLTFNPAAEARADAVASGTVRPSGGATHGVGAQASFTFDFIRSVVGELTDPDEVKKIAKKIEARERKPVDFGEDKKTPQLMKALETQFAAAVSDSKIAPRYGIKDKLSSNLMKVKWAQTVDHEKTVLGSKMP